MSSLVMMAFFHLVLVVAWLWGLPPIIVRSHLSVRMSLYCQARLDSESEIGRRSIRTQDSCKEQLSEIQNVGHESDYDTATIITIHPQHHYNNMHGDCDSPAATKL
ncbi:hypothetical protein EV363DRAFT_1317670 [Boletus edulis]|nr:hypothetical protein EV363DRAFT_1317670 [Boletus edulis]